jgi:PAC2 family protein
MATPGDPLTILEATDGLRRPILVMAFGGWNDAAESATSAARYLGQLWSARPLASIDPEEFYHFGLSRPYVRFKSGSRHEREIVWPATEFSLSQPTALDRDLIVGVAIEPHLKWRTYCNAVLSLARASRASLVLTLGALLAEVPHTRPVRLSGSAYDPELAARLGVRPTRYEGPTGIVGVLNTMCREQGVGTASLWANVPHYISGIENPKASMALVRRVLTMLNVEADLTDLEDATRQFDTNLEEIVSQNAKIADYVKKLERKKPDEEEEDASPAPRDELPASGDLVAEIEQFLKQQPRPEQ